MNKLMHRALICILIWMEAFATSASQDDLCCRASLFSVPFHYFRISRYSLLNLHNIQSTNKKIEIKIYPIARLCRIRMTLGNKIAKRRWIQIPTFSTFYIIKLKNIAIEDIMYTTHILLIISD
ncbi:hypothetical protein ACJX0J_036866 [Zea mays]